MERNTASVRAVDEQLDALLGHRGAATVSLLFALSDGAKRFGVLRSQMGRMSQKTLVAELRALEQLGAVERIVRAYPAQWFWMHNRWKTDADGAPL